MKKFKIDYTGGTLVMLGMTFFSLTVVLIPVAIILLLRNIEIRECESDEQTGSLLP